jgi:hypothetical protein
VTRLRKSALAFIAIASVVVAGGCSSGTKATITDPNEVITKSVSGAPAITTLHVKVELSGKLDISSLGSAASAIGLGGNLDLAGTSAEGDVDVTKQAADLNFTLPAPLGTGEVILVDGNAYYKLGLLTGGKFSKQALGSSLPISLPSPGAIASVDPSAAIADLKTAMDSVGATATLKATDQVAGKEAYHVSIAIPVDKINSQLAASGTSATAGMQLSSLTLDYWVYTESNLPAKFVVAVGAGALGTFNLTVTLSDYGKSVTVNAPAPGDIAG